MVFANLLGAELAAALLAPGARWWGIDAALPTPYPWLSERSWSGPVEGLAQAETWHLHVTTTPRADGTALILVRRLSDGEVLREAVMRAVESMRDMFTLTTGELTSPGPAYLMVNQTFERISGYARSEVLGLTPRILQGPRTDPSEIGRLRRCLEADEPFRGGTVNYRANGDEFFNEWSIAAVTSPSGSRQYVSVMRDATNERLRADQIRAAATEWARVVDVLDELVVFVDLDRRILRCNEGFRRLAGLTYAELIGRNLIEVIFPGTASAEVEAILHGADIPARLSRRSGRFRVTSHPVHDGPRLAGWVHVFDDVTERERRAEQVQRLVTAIEQAHDGVALIDSSGHIEYLNQAYANLLGIDRAAAIGLEGHRLLSGADSRGVFDAALARARSEDITWRVRPCPDGGLRHELSVRQLTDDAGSFTGYAVSARDMTEHDRLIRLSEATSAMDNMSHWLSGLRHELGNPVNSVKMALTVLASNLASMPTDEVARYVQRALSELGRIEYLLRTLRAVSAIEQLDLTKVNLAPFLAQVASLVGPDLRARGVNFSIDCAPELAGHGEPHALVQVLVNVVANAADAVSGRSDGFVEITAHHRGPEVCIVVRDNGVGISAARLARLYSPFDTTKAGGTGLGLVIVRRLMTAMNGRIVVDSTEHVGTLVTLSLEAR